MISRFWRVLVLPLALLCPVAALAGPFSSLFVFGDSLSDTGNTVGSGVPRPWPLAGPYDGGRFSNGPLWVESVASRLGLAGQADSFQAGGHNYAFAGSLTGFLPPAPQAQLPGLLLQSQVFWGDSHPVADPDALYVVVSGGNDLRDASLQFSGSSVADGLGREAVATNAIANMATTIGFLASRGAKNFLVASVPDLGYTPEAILLNLTAASSDASHRFNALMPGLVGWGLGQGLRMNFLDLSALNDAIVADPARYGMVSIDSPCAGFLAPLAPSGVGTVSCDVSLFSDILHPTAYAHTLIGHAALVALGLPEPGSMALIGLALLSLVLSRRRRAGQ